jgi:hypothetical protein
MTDIKAAMAGDIKSRPRSEGDVVFISVLLPLRETIFN